MHEKEIQRDKEETRNNNLKSTNENGLTWG